jgi:preprotein translocase subunit SecD
MIEYAKWKYVLVGIVLLFAGLYALPNLYPQDYAVQVAGTRGNAVDQALVERVKTILSEAKLETKSVALEEGLLLARVPNNDIQNQAVRALNLKLNEGSEDQGNRYNVALNLASTVPAWLRAIGGKPLTLGLDLQGGVSFLLEIDSKDAVAKLKSRLREGIYSSLKANDVLYRGVDIEEKRLIIRLDNDDDRKKARELLATSTEFKLEDGEGSNLVAVVDELVLIGNANATIDQNTKTLRNRMNNTGVAEPIIQRQGLNRIVVQLPGVQDTAEAKKLLATTATLEYRAVVDQGVQAVQAKESGVVPAGAMLLETREGQPILVNTEIIASGDQLLSATDGIDPQSGTAMVSVRLNSQGGDRMLDFTSQNVGKPMAVVFVERIPVTRLIDGKETQDSITRRNVIKAATIQGVFSTSFQTTGLENREEAKDLATFLNSGALAAPLNVVQERVVGPSLGQASIEAGRMAVMVGFSVVVVFMLIYYKVFGVISVLGLLTNVLLLIALLGVINATMTLPGIAGVALTLGMAIDANVLINERIREELRNGMTPLASIKAGYEKAWSTIIDSNLTTLIAGIALFAFGSGPVRGFAVVLCLGILTTMFTAVTVTYAIVALAYGNRRKVAKISV